MINKKIENRKQLILGVLTILTGSFFWISLWRVFYSTSTEQISVASVFLPILAYILYVLSSTFFVLITREFKKGLIIFGAVSLVAFFLFGAFRDLSTVGILFVGVSISLLSKLLSVRGFKIERDARLKMEIRKILPKFLPMFFTGSFLLVSVVYLISPALSKSVDDVSIPRFAFNSTIKPLEFVSQRFIPTFDLDEPVEELLYTITIIQSFGDGSAENVTPSQDLLSKISELGFETGELNPVTFLKNPKLFELVQLEAARQIDSIDENLRSSLRVQFGEQFGIHIEPELTTGEFIYIFINKELNKFNNKYSGALPIVLVFGLFITLKTIGLPFMWFNILLAMIVFKILKKTGIYTIEEIDVKKETVIL